MVHVRPGPVGDDPSTDRERLIRERLGALRDWCVCGGLAVLSGTLVGALAWQAGTTYRTTDLCTYNIEGAAHGQVARDCTVAPFCPDECQQRMVDLDKQREADRLDCIRRSAIPTPHYEEGCEPD